MPSINPNYSFRISGFLSESGEVSEHALPPLILLHENVRSSLVRRELFPQIFCPSMSYRGDSSSVRVGAYSNILGVHGFAKFAFHFKNFLFSVTIPLRAHDRCRRS